MDTSKKLKEKYTITSKHSNYQILASNLIGLIQIEDSNIISRFEKERLAYIVKKINLSDKKIADIGGNTGYFSFESLNCGAQEVLYFEGNEDHADFVSMASDVIGCKDQIKICNEYFSFGMNNKRMCDIMFLLNVVHHVGDDYGDKNVSITNAKEEIINSLKNISKTTKILIFQMGYNWKGDTSLPLFKKGTKTEQIEFISDSLRDFFEITDIGIPVRDNNLIIYQDKNNSNLKRMDSMGEFLNRPLFLMKSKKI